MTRFMMRFWFSVANGVLLVGHVCGAAYLEAENFQTNADGYTAQTLNVTTVADSTQSRGRSIAITAVGNTARVTYILKKGDLPVGDYYVYIRGSNDWSTAGVYWSANSQWHVQYPLVGNTAPNLARIAGTGLKWYPVTVQYEPGWDTATLSTFSITADGNYYNLCISRRSDGQAFPQIDTIAFIEKTYVDSQLVGWLPVDEVPEFDFQPQMPIRPWISYLEAEKYQTNVGGCVSQTENITTVSDTTNSGGKSIAITSAGTARATYMIYKDDLSVGDYYVYVRGSNDWSTAGVYWSENSQWHIQYPLVGNTAPNLARIAGTGLKWYPVTVQYEPAWGSATLATFSVTTAGNYYNLCINRRSDGQAFPQIDTIAFVKKSYVDTQPAGWLPEDSVPTFGYRPRATGLTAGHEILLERGLQIQALSSPLSYAVRYFDTDAWADARFTSMNFWDSFHPSTDIPPVAVPADLLWSRQAGGNPAKLNLNSGEQTYLSSMLSFLYSDEDNIRSAELVNNMKNWYSLNRERYPDVISYSNMTLETYTGQEVHDYVIQAKPDMISFDNYPFNGYPTYSLDGDPEHVNGQNRWYGHMQIIRQIGLGGLDDDGKRPIPYGQFLQTWKVPIPPAVSDPRHTPSESEIRINQFVSWAMGYTYLCAFTYDKYGESNADYPIMFDGIGTSVRSQPAFDQVAETNRQSRNLGSALMRLISTDFRILSGRHHGTRNHWYEVDEQWEVNNHLPTGVLAWSASVDPYLTGINVTNIGTCNTYIKDDLFSSWTVKLPGDVMIGYFKPLHESFDGPNYTNEKYFMVVNGLTDVTGTAVQTRQRIRLNFNFGSSGITRLQRIRGSDGLVEVVTLVSDGGSLYHLDLELDGGTGDLFKYNTGAPFVGANTGDGSQLEIPGDANGDGMVDVGDLGILAANYGQSGKTWAQGDFNHDGVVDVGDLGILAAHYGEGVSGSVDFKTDAKALGLVVSNDKMDVEAEGDPLGVSTSGCGFMGLPLLVGMILACLMFDGLKIEE